jgi:hypothetical protein
MKINFPNNSRSFDANRSRVCFWGYDSTIEISFFVGADALKQLSPDMDSEETGFLNAFDAGVERIHEVADKVYVHGGKGKGTYTYILEAKDF